MIHFYMLKQKLIILYQHQQITKLGCDSEVLQVFPQSIINNSWDPQLEYFFQSFVDSVIGHFVDSLWV